MSPISYDMFFVRHRRREDTQRRIPHEDGGRDGSDATIIQGALAASQDEGKRNRMCSRACGEKGVLPVLWFGFLASRMSENELLFFQAIEFVEIYCGSHRNTMHWPPKTIEPIFEYKQTSLSLGTNFIALQVLWELRRNLSTWGCHIPNSTAASLTVFLVWAPLGLLVQRDRPWLSCPSCMQMLTPPVQRGFPHPWTLVPAEETGPGHFPWKPWLPE